MCIELNRTLAQTQLYKLGLIYKSRLQRSRMHILSSHKWLSHFWSREYATISFSTSRCISNPGLDGSTKWCFCYKIITHNKIKKIVVQSPDLVFLVIKRGHLYSQINKILYKMGWHLPSYNLTWFLACSMKYEYLPGDDFATRSLSKNKNSCSQLRTLFFGNLNKLFL